MNNKFFPFIFALFTLSAMVSCEILDSYGQKPTKIISIHEIVKYPRATELEKEIPTLNGGKIWINTNPFLHSSAIKQIKLVPSAQEPGFYDLQVELDRCGRLLWMQISVGFAYRKLAFVIDGIYYRSIIPRYATTEEDYIVLIEGPFDKITAESLKEHAAKNYSYYHMD